MSLTTIIILVISSLVSLFCAAIVVIVPILLIVGFMVLRRRGKKDATAKEALDAGVERVSQVFRRTQGGGLEAVDDEGDDNS